MIACLLVAGCAASAPESASEEGQGAAPSAQLAGQPSAGWLSAGNGASNTRHQGQETRISPQTVGRLKAKWTVRTAGGVGATPAVDETAVYFPDNAGNITAVDRATGRQIWQRKVGDITGSPGASARVTPAIDGDVLYLGDQSAPPYDRGANFFALDKKTGATIWKVVLDSQPVARVAQSAVVHGDLVYVGLSSYIERLSTNPAFKCCPFRGNFVALNKKTGAVVWRTYLTPGPETGFSGVAVWGSTPVIDTKRNQVIITTANNYTASPAFIACGNMLVSQVESCIKSVPRANENLFDAIVALDLATGKVKWSRTLQPFDVWVTACALAFGRPSGNCQSIKGNDYDFGQGAIAYTANVGGQQRDLVGAGQKSGIFYSVSADDGTLAWQTTLGPGGILGGMAWGSAYDGKRIYTANANSSSRPWSFKSGGSTRSGFWSAVDAATGQIVWETAGTPAATGTNPASVSSANGVVFGGLQSGVMYAFDAATGKTLWSFRAAGAVIAGPAIVDGAVYWGSGAGQLGANSPSSALYAFEVSGTVAQPVTPVDPIRPTVDAGIAPTGPSWRSIYDKYLGLETAGHCTNCHVEMSDAKSSYDWLTAKGQIDGTASPLGIQGQSRLIWLGGSMPPDGSGNDPEAAAVLADVKAWIAIGAPNN